MKVLIACEYSGVTRNAFLARGHDAISCDLLPADDNSTYHYQGPVEDLSAEYGGFDLMIAHPPCTYLCASGLHWNDRGRGGWKETEKALEFVRMLMALPIEKIAIENPVGRISTAIRPPDQYIHPYEFGHDASKKTGLWLKNLPPLKPTRYIDPRMVNGRPRWGNQCDSGQNNLRPSAERWKIRAKTYQGVAEAMAEQWGFLA
jgi:hypothetical protein